MQQPPKILIIGAGAIGGFYGAKLAQAGAEVSVICRSDFDFVKKNGFNIKSHWDEKDFNFKPYQVLKNIKEYQEEPDFILVSTKVLPSISVVDLIKPALSKNSSIILLQNGIHIEKPISNAFPNHHLISILAFVCVSKLSPGNIHHQDYGRLVAGDFPSGVSEKTKNLVTLWNQSGVTCEATSNIQIERWKKLIWNAPFNPISVLKNADTKEILDDEKSRVLVKNIMQEICLLAKADGCELATDIADKNIAMTLSMKPYKTSMLLDFEEKRPLEIEAILGNALKFAQEKSINTPFLLEVYEELLKY